MHFLPHGGGMSASVTILVVVGLVTRCLSAEQVASSAPGDSMDLLEHNMLAYPTLEKMLAYRQQHMQTRTKRQAIKGMIDK